MKVTTFNHEIFGELRTVIMPDGQIGFVGKDVARALGYKAPSQAIIAHVEDEDKMLMQLPTDEQNANLWRSSKTAVISESGVYSLILSSKLAQAYLRAFSTAEISFLSPYMKDLRYEIEELA